MPSSELQTRKKNKNTNIIIKYIQLQLNPTINTLKHIQVFQKLKGIIIYSEKNPVNYIIAAHMQVYTAWRVLS